MLWIRPKFPDLARTPSESQLKAELAKLEQQITDYVR